jgi:hypothetical protein
MSRPPAGRGSSQPAENTRKKLFAGFADNYALFPHNHRIAPNPGFISGVASSFLPGAVVERFNVPGEIRELEWNAVFTKTGS